nr:putative ribonuclease H-like domain-containing protein [Tanacetum cinerariifolium]
MRVNRFYKKTRRKPEFNGKEPVGFDKIKVECFHCHRRGHFARDCKTARNSGDKSRDAGNAGYRGRDNEEEATDFAFMAFTLNPSSSSSSNSEHEILRKANLEIVGYQYGLESIEGQLRVHQQNEVIYEKKIRVLEYDVKDKSNFIKYTQKQLDEALREKEDLKAKIKKLETSSKNLTKLLDSQISAKVKTGIGYDSQFNEKEVLDVKEKEVTETVFDNHLSDEENSLANDRFKKGGYHAVPPLLTGNYIPPKSEQLFARLDDSIYKFKISKIVTSLTKDEKDALETSTDFVENTKEVRTSAPLIQDLDTDSDNDSVFRPTHIPAKIDFVKDDCTFHEYRMAKKFVLPNNVGKGTGHKESRPVWNNVQRINHQKKFAPTAVFIRSGRIPVSATKPKAAASTSVAKPVNTTGPKQSVNFSKSRSTFHNSHSPIRRVTAVKTSAGCVWRPRVNEIDQISKDNRWIYTRVDNGYPRQALKNKGIVDSGCSRHMTWNKAYLTDDHEINDRDYVAFGSSRGKITGKASIDEFNLWHRRLGHVNFKTMNKLVKENLIRGLPSKIFENYQTCVACQTGKQHKATCKAKLLNSISQPLQMLHMDLFAPTSVMSINHKKYCLVVTDDFSRFSWVFFLATKDETSKVLKSFITAIENQINMTVKVIRCDNRTKFKNRDLDEFCGMKWIKREYSNAKTPQQNRVTKRKNMTLIEAARTMLANSVFPFTFWAKAVNTAWNQTDINAGPQDTNGNVGTQNNVDTGKEVSDQHYVVLPLWSSISSTFKSSDDKPKDDTGSKTVEEPVNKEDQAYRDELKRLMSQEKEASDAEGALRKEFKQGCMDQRGVTKAGSTHSFNIVSNPVNVASTLGTFSAGRPSYPHPNAFIPANTLLHVDQNDSPIPYLEDTAELRSTGIFNSAYDDDLDIFTSSSQSIGAEADFTNMESSTIFSPIPTHRMEPKKLAQALDDKIWVEAMQEKLLIEAIRIFLAFASFMGFIVYQMDVKGAFLYGTIEEEVYVSQPPGFINLQFPNKVDKVYVDDIIFGSTKKSLCDEFEALMHKRFQMSSIGELTFFLGLQVKESENGIFISQDKPDIMVAVCACSRFHATPKLSHLHAVKRIFRYLKGNPQQEAVNFLAGDYIHSSARSRLLLLILLLKQSMLLLLTAMDRLPYIEFYSSFSHSQQPVVEGAGLGNPPEYQPTSSPAQPINESKILESSSSPQNTQSARHTLEGTSFPHTRGPNFLDPSVDVVAVYKEGVTVWCELLLLLGEGLGSGLGHLETIRGAMAHIRYEGAFIQSINPPLSIGHTPGSDEGSMTLKELMDLYTTFLQTVLDLENVKTAQAKEISSLKKRVTKMEQRQSSRISGFHPFRAGTSKRHSLGRRKTRVMVKKEVAQQKQLVLLGQILVLRPEVSIVEPKTPPSIETLFDDEDVTIADTLVKMKNQKAKEKGIAFKDADDSTRPIRSITTLQPIPAIDPKDKEHLDEEARIEIERQEEASKATLADMYDEVEDEKRIGSRKKREASSSSKYKSPKKQKVNDHKYADSDKELKKCDVHVYKLTRLDGSYKHFSTFFRMLEVLDRQHVFDLHKITMERFLANDPEGYDLLL